MSEAQLQTCVIDLAHAYGWKVAHFRPAQTSKGWRTPVGGDGAGFPDLVLAKMGHVLFIELKGAKGKVSAAQHSWLAHLAPRFDIWRPADWHSGEILRTLSAPSPIEEPPKPAMKEKP